MTLRPYRSVLYIPGSRARALDKARSMQVDSIIFDLEDAVALEEKASALATLVAHLAEGGYGVRSQIIRINGLDTPWGTQDIAAIAEVRPDFGNRGNILRTPRCIEPIDANDLAAHPVAPFCQMRHQSCQRRGFFFQRYSIFQIKNYRIHLHATGFVERARPAARDVENRTIGT